MDKLEELYLVLMENNGQDYEESGTIFTEDFVKEIAASKSAELTKQLMIAFAEFCLSQNPEELLEIFLKEKYGE